LLFGAYMARIARGEDPGKVLAELAGGTMRGARWAHEVEQVLKYAAIRDNGALRGEPVRASSESRAKMAWWLLYHMSLLRRHGGPIYCTGPKLYRGRDRRLKKAAKPAPESQPADDTSCGVPSFDEVLEEYCPSKSAGGLAARLKRSPRTQNSYARAWEAGGGHGKPRRGIGLVVYQPKRDAEGAVCPRNGDWAYSRFELRVDWMPEAILRQLREYWGEVEPLEHGEPARGTPEQAERFMHLPPPASSRAPPGPS